MKDAEIMEILKERFGYSNEQFLKEFSEAEKEVKRQGIKYSGDYEDLKRRIEEIEKGRDEIN